MNTGDKYDRILHKGDMLHVCSIHTSTRNMIKHAHKTKFCFYWPLIDGFDGELTSEVMPEDNMWPLIHGLVMSIGWGVLVDFGISAVRYFRVRKHYVISHALFMALMTLTTLPMVILMIVRNRRSIFFNFDVMEWTTRAHFILGALIIVVVVCEGIIGVFTKVSQEGESIPSLN
jgi:hypothetical protein